MTAGYLPPADSSVLGRILLVQSAVQTAPDGDRLAELLARGLSDLPGISKTIVCVEGYAVISADGDVQHLPIPATSSGVPPDCRNCPADCPIEGAAALTSFPLQAVDKRYGAVMLDRSDASAFAPCEPFVANTANFAALHMENTKRKVELESLNARLETEVAERTKYLQESEEQHRTLVEGSLQGVVIAQDSPIRLAFANSAMAELTGHSVEALLSMGPDELSELIAPADRPRFLDNFRRRLAGEDIPAHQDYDLLRPDGTVVFVHCLSNCIIYRGEPATLTAFVDITPRRVAEAALARSEQKYRTLVENQNDLIIEFTPQFEVEYVSPSYCETFDVTEETILGRSFFDLVHEEDRDRVRVSLAATTKPPYRTAHEERALTTDGWRWFSWSAKGRVGEDGQTVSIVSVGRDTTEQKEAEAALRASERKFAGLFEAAPMLMTISCIETGRYLAVNDTFVRLTGYSRDAAVGHTSTAIGFIDAAAREVLRKRITAEGSIRNVELRVRHADGQEMVCLYSGQVINSGGESRLLSIAADITERKRAEESLRLSEERFRDLTDLLPQAVWEADLKGNLTYLNQAGYSTFGCSPEDVEQGVCIPDLLAPEERERALVNFGKAQDDPTRIGGSEYKCVKKSGESFPALVLGSPIEVGGRVTGVRGIALDLTAQRRLERDYEQLFATVLTGFAVHEIIHDTDGHPVDYRFVKINPAFEKMTGLDRQIIGKTVLEVIPDVDRDLIDRYGRVVSTGEPDHFEHTSATLDKVFEVTAFRNAPDQFACMLVDVTPRREAEAELRRLAAAIEQASEAVEITDTDGTIQYVNPAFERQTGYTRGEVVGANPSILKSGKHDEAFYRQMWDTLKGGETWDGRFINRRKNGELFTEEAVISPVRDDSGRTVSYVAVKRDITEELDLQEQLQQAGKLEAVGRLAGGVAHDYNNIVMGIMNYVELCRDGLEAGKPVGQWLDEITREAKRSAALTRQLLAFARKESIAPKPVCLNDTLADMSKMLRRLIGEDIKLSWEPGADLWKVLIDPGQVDQILANLCINARDAIEGAGRITIATQNRSFSSTDRADVGGVPGDYVELTVADSGCGMDPETLKHVFEPFFTTKAAGKGTGLGLATVYGIVKQNAGHVTVETEPGKGTSFAVLLPRLETAAEDEGADTPQAPEIRGGDETILLVEDEPSIRITVGIFLEQLGYTVLVAETPAVAIELADTHPDSIDFLLTDVIMPGMNGRELAQRLLGDSPSMRYLYMSGYTADVIAQSGLLDEGADLLKKPISRDELALKVRDLLDRGKE